MTAILLAVFAAMASSAWAAPPLRPVRPPVRVTPPSSTPIRPPAEAFVPPRVGPSIPRGSLPDESLRGGGSSFRPAPIVRYRGRPGDEDDQERSAGAAGQRAPGATEERSRGSWPLWWLFLLIPLAGGLLLVFFLVLVIDLAAKRRRAPASPNPLPPATTP
jgi:hypothetical protein